MGRHRRTRVRPGAARHALSLLTLFVAVTVGAVLPAIAGAALRREEAAFAPLTADGQVPVLVRTADAAGVASRVRELGGRVLYVFHNVDAVSATVPQRALADLLADPRVGEARRQRMIHRAIVPSRLPSPADIGSRSESDLGEIVPLRSMPTGTRPVSLDRPSGSGALRGGPTSFFGYDILTGAAESWEVTGFGEGVIVSIIDTGVFPAHPMYAGNVIGGENLVPGEEEQAIDLDGDGAGDGRSFDWDSPHNNGHGTLIAGMIAGHVDLEFPDTDPFLQSVAIHSPESVEFDGAGGAVIRLMGAAPGASLYALKVFPYDGGSAPDARVAEAIDRVIERKRSGELDTDVINMSLSGPVLFDGWNPLDQTVDAATEAGITVVSAASNDGPSVISVGSPASAFTGLAVGAALDPIHTRVAVDIFTDTVGLGTVVFPYEMPMMVDFSSRGPTADRRVKPDLIATGFFVFTSTLLDFDGDGVSDGPAFGFASGTSLSTPTVSGVAALVTAYGDRIGRNARAPYVANAMRNGAVPIADLREVSQVKQGRGFVNVPSALAAMDAGNVLTAEPADPRNAQATDLNLRNGGSASGSTGDLAPGQTHDFLVHVPHGTTSLRVEFPAVDLAADGNPVFGEGVEAAVHSAQRGGSGDYVFFRDGLFAPLVAGDFVEVPFPEPGTMRITVGGAFPNYEPVSVDVNVTARRDPVPVDHAFTGRLTRNEVVQHTVDVPAGIGALAVRLSWRHDWTRYPTYDLDMFISGPDGFVPAASLDSPELAWIEAPTAGTYTFTILDFGTVDRGEPYDLAIAFFGGAGQEAARLAGAVEAPRPRIEGAVPNPVRGASELSFTIDRPGPVALEVFDVTGRSLRKLVDGELAAGRHRVTWDGRTESGARAAAGVYFLRLETAQGSSTRKLTLLK